MELQSFAQIDMNRLLSMIKSAFIKLNFEANMRIGGADHCFYVTNGVKNYPASIDVLDKGSALWLELVAWDGFPFKNPVAICIYSPTHKELLTDLQEISANQNGQFFDSMSVNALRSWLLQPEAVQIVPKLVEKMAKRGLTLESSPLRYAADAWM